MPRLLPCILLVLLPLVFAAGLRLAQLAVGERQLAKILAPGCALAAWLLSVHVVGLVSRSFWVGLFTGTLIAAAAGLLALLRGPGELADGEPLRWKPLAGGLAAAVLLLGIEVRFAMWDESIVTGHLAIPLQMLNGIYPPRNLSFAQFELRYHYGFDLLCAAVAAILGQPAMWKVVHAVTLLLFGWCASLLWVLGERWIGRRAGPVAAALALFAGGLPIGCGPEGSRPVFMNRCMLPEFPSNFLQHPWSLGIPLALSAMLVFESRRTSMKGWWIALSLLMVALSLSQVVLFLCLLCGIACAGVVAKPRWQSAAAFAAFCLVMLGCAWLCHGFFAHVAEPAGNQVTFNPFWNRFSVEQFVARSLGVSLVLGPIGFLYLRTGRILLAATALASLAVFHLFTYPTPWDMAKFLMVAQLALALLSAAALASWVRRSLGLRLLAGGAALGSMAMAANFYAAGNFAGGAGYFPSEIASFASPADAAVAEYLRKNVQAGEAILRTHNPLAYSVRAGLPTTLLDDGAVAFGFSPQLKNERTALLRHPSNDVDRYLHDSIAWIVAAPEDVELVRNAEQWIASGRATEPFSAAPLRLFRLQR